MISWALPVNLSSCTLLPVFDLVNLFLLLLFTYTQLLLVMWSLWGFDLNFLDNQLCEVFFHVVISHFHTFFLRYLFKFFAYLKIFFRIFVLNCSNSSHILVQCLICYLLQCVANIFASLSVVFYLLNNTLASKVFLHFGEV